MKFRSVFNRGCALILILTFFQACRKGDNDPLFSLKTRKARISKEWKVSFSERTKDDTTFLFNGEEEVVKIGDVELARIPSAYSYLFEKNGTYSIETSKSYPSGYLDSTSVASTIQTLEVGSWSFAGGFGDVKRKEQILLLPSRWERRTEGFAEVDIKTWEGQTAGRVFNIDMLKSKEMRWIYSQTSNTPLGVSTEEGTIEFQ